jgi:decaprenyl-phosphate phosphoribosyltransferase
VGGVAVIPIIRLMRPHQWVKNLLLVGPLLFTPAAMNGPTVLLVALGVACFSILSSAIYAVNDVLDAERDRLHAVKCKRPVASGAVSPGAALVLAAVCAVAALAGAAWLGREFAVICVVYAVVNVAYSLKLKNIAILDVLCIAFSFLLRIYSGSVLIGFATGPWIQLCTGLLALFLALAKRRDDLVREMASVHRPSLAGYNKPFLDAALAVMLSAMLVSYVIYTTNQDVAEKLGTHNLHATVPFVVAGILRYLQLIYVHERSGAPTVVLLTDWPLIVVVLGWLGTAVALIYG